MTSSHPQIRVLPLSAFVFSQTPMQVARRQMRTKAEVTERAENMKTLGVLQPVVARPIAGKTIGTKASVEMAAGEGRHLSAAEAGIPDLPAIVREMTDEELEQIQIGENLMRDDVHELVEALGYDSMVKRGRNVAEIASQVGQSTGYVYARLKLLSLCEPGRQAFLEGVLTGSTALLVARLPGEELQARALKQLTEKDYHGRVMSYRDAVRYIHETFHLKLSAAPFDTEDAALVPEAGPCGSCPMRTGNQPELFDDVKSGDVCTSPPCFQAKKAAHIKAALEKAKATGERVIRGGEARRILPRSHGYMYSSNGSHKQLRNGFARPSDVCLDDPKGRTYAELAGKDAAKVLLQNPDTGAISKVFDVEAIRDRLKEKGVKPPPKAADSAEQRKLDHERAEQAEEQQLEERRAIFRAVLNAAPTKLGKADLANLISAQFEQGYGNDDDFYKALGWEKPKGAGGRAKFREQLLKLTEGELAQLAVAVPVIGAVLDMYGDRKDLDALAKRFKVDVKKVRADLKPVEEPKPVKKAKASKKKAARK